MPELPSISIVVPNFNNGSTLARALQSLVDQQYPRLEILLVDGGSTDNSLEVIRQFEPHLAWWVSEKDRGQCHGINKALAHATGEICNWLCSDDFLFPGALEAVGRYFSAPGAPDVIAGKCLVIDQTNPDRDALLAPDPAEFDLMPCINPIQQSSCFFRRRLLDRTPPLDENLHRCLDFELWMYFKSNGARWKFVPDTFSTFWNTATNKAVTGGEKSIRENEIIYKRYVRERVPLTYWHRRLRYPLERIRHRHPGRLFGWLIYYPWQCSVIAILSPFYGFKRVKTMNWVPWAFPPRPDSV